MLLVRPIATTHRRYAALARFTAGLGLIRTTWADRRGTMKSLELEYGEIDYVFVSEAYVQGRNATVQLPWTRLSDHRMIAAVVRAG